MKTIVTLLALFSSVSVVISFSPTSPGSSPNKYRRSVVVQSSIVTNDDVTSFKRRDIQDELKRLGVSYHDCFDRESLIHRLIEARENGSHIYTKDNGNLNPTTFKSSSSIKAVVDVTPSLKEKLIELRAMTLKDLKLQCSRRNIRYYKFLEKEDFVRAVWEDMQKAFEFSVTGVVRPGMVAEVTGEQLDQEMTRSDSLVLVDVYATWCGPCKMLVPQLEAAAMELGDTTRVVKLDSDKHGAWAGRFQVQGLPTMLLIKNGLVVDRLEGAHMTNGIVAFVEKHL